MTGVKLETMSLSLLRPFLINFISKIEAFLALLIITSEYDNYQAKKEKAEIEKSVGCFNNFFDKGHNILIKY